MTYLKHAWPTEGQFITDMLSAGFATMEEDQITFVDCYVHQIGLVENDPRWAVDIIWTGDVQFESLCVWPTPGSAVHFFAGYEAQYAADFCANNPESPFCTLALENE
jgi:hypothetical protein